MRNDNPPGAFVARQRFAVARISQNYHIVRQRRVELGEREDRAIIIRRFDRQIRRDDAAQGRLPEFDASASMARSSTPAKTATLP